MVSSIAIGDIVSRPKLVFIKHVGIYLGCNLVLHNAPGKGEHVSTIGEFANGQPLTVQRTNANPSKVAARVRRMLANPRRYDVLQRNCEHTAYEAAAGNARSPMVALFALVGVFLVIWCWFRR